MKDHVLLTNATRRPYKEIPDLPAGINYDSSNGYWVKDGKPLATSKEFLEGRSTTKKCDQETGEDLKGE